MKVVLVTMPWAVVDRPSLALGILRNAVKSELPEADVTVVHGNIDYVDWITGRDDFSVTDYRHYAAKSYFSGSGDWIFSSALYGDPEWRVSEFEKSMEGKVKADRIAKSVALHESAPAFIDELAGRITALAPDVVGFTTTFQQNTASLAAARAIKRLDPAVMTVFGGANCDGEQGAALHRNFPFADFTVRGEGESAFTRLLAVLRDGHGQYARIPGLCWRDADGASVANALPRSPLAPAQIGTPDFDDYFDRISASVARGWSEPGLVVEGARGCWWGQKHHCTFCGLNGSSMQFRSKPPDEFARELLALVARHGVLDVSVVDNILDMRYLTSALPAIADAGYDLRISYEIKANMRRDQLRTLLDAGVVHVQPGIENLSSKVLKLMRKGATGCQNVRLLRDAESLGMQVAWNYLCGFPGERDDDYVSLISQFPVLHHLAPPGGAGRIAIERFSPYYSQPELGFTDIAVDPQYRVTYDLPERELTDLAYLFTASPRGVGQGVADRLAQAARVWEDSYYAGSRLTQCEAGEEIVLVNTRPGFSWRVLTVTDPAEIAVFRLLDQPHSADALARKLDSAGVTAQMLAGLLPRWQALGLLFAENGQFIQVATAATNQELHRIGSDG